MIRGSHPPGAEQYLSFQPPNGSSETETDKESEYNWHFCWSCSLLLVSLSFSFDGVCMSRIVSWCWYVCISLHTKVSCDLLSN